MLYGAKKFRVMGVTIVMVSNKLRTFSWLLTVPLAGVVALIVTYTGAFGGEVSVVRVVFGTVLALAMVASPFLLPTVRGLFVAMGILAAVTAWWASHEPSNERQWSEPAARTPWATMDGSRVTIHDVRDFRYNEDGTWQANWYDATYDLEELEQSYFILTAFGGLPGLAHVMVSFRFAGEKFIILSVEIRREEGESYDPIGGIFRQYELFYTAADERDALALRLFVHKDPTWVIPMNAGREKTAAFFLDMVERMTKLHREPEWYNSVTNSCASNLASHYERVNEVRLPPDYRILMPGFSEALIAELDLLPEGVDVATARATYQVNDVALKLSSLDDFSVAIRNWESPPVEP
jgi:hypothetical protein